jgi:hypothetical protein
MSVVREPLPKGRYGRRDDAAADRTLRITAIVLGGLLVVGLVLAGWWYSTRDSVNGDVITFKVVSDSEVRAELQVYKGADQSAVCTLRSQAADQSEVGRRNVTVSKHGTTVDTVVTIRTTARGTTAELVGCQPAKSG